MNSLGVRALLKHKAGLLVSAIRGAIIICCVITCVVCMPAKATEDELRLFHLPESDIDNSNAKSDSSSDLTEGSSAAADDISGRDEDSTKKKSQSLQKIDKPFAENTVQERTYRYDGFVLSESGTTYLINGQPLGLNSQLQLLEELNGGSTLKLKTKSGHVFVIGIGGTIKEVKQ